MTEPDRVRRAARRCSGMLASHSAMLASVLRRLAH